MSVHSTNPEGRKVPVQIFIDHTNVFIQGKKSFPAVIKKYSDINYIKLFERGELKTVQEPTIVGSYGPYDLQPKYDPFWINLKKNGFITKVYERKHNNKEKLVDSEIITRICETIFTQNPGTNPGTIVLIAGDGDYIPPLLKARRRGWDVEIWFWNKGFAYSLENLATKVEYLTPENITDASNKKNEKGIQPTYEESIILGIQPNDDKESAPTTYEEQIIAGTSNIF